MDPGAPNTSANTPGTPRPTAAVPLRLLLADDNDVNQEAGKRILERRGHSVVLAGTGKQVLELLAASAYDIVLMDVQMPEMDGLTATAEIRRREIATGRHISVIALTAHARAEDRDRCLAAGMDGFLSKPFRSTELVAAMEKLELGPTLAPANLAPSRPESSFDLAGLLARVDGDHDLLATMLTLFDSEVPRLLAESRLCLDKGDAPGVREAAHALRSCVGNFEAHRAVELALALETLGDTGSVAQAEAPWRALEAEIGRLGADLAALGARS